MQKIKFPVTIEQSPRSQVHSVKPTLQSVWRLNTYKKRQIKDELFSSSMQSKRTVKTVPISVWFADVRKRDTQHIGLTWRKESIANTRICHFSFTVFVWKFYNF